MKNCKPAMLLPVLFAFLVSCTREDIPVPPGNSSVNKTVLLQLVNDVRKKGCNCGDIWYGPAPAVSWNSALEKAAQSHSDDMKEKRYFSHISPDGSDAGDRITKAGYNWSNYGENIAEGYINEKSVIEGWLSSPGHCSNIMNKSFTEMGAGKSGGYWTQILAVE